jgi:hypothetical protein
MLGFPAPKVWYLPGTPVPGLDRQGNPRDCLGTIVVSLSDVPPIYLSTPGLIAALELVRYVPTARKKTPSSGYKKVGAGLRHPAPPGAGSGQGGTRGGTINGLGPGVTRPTSWPIAGLTYGSQILLPVGEVFAGYFQLAKVEDGGGNAVNTLQYYMKPKQRNGSKGVKWYNKGPLVGVFRFRFAAKDAATGRMVSGPLSEAVYVFPNAAAVIPQPGGSGAYAKLNQVNTGADAARLLQLTARVGARVR